MISTVTSPPLPAGFNFDAMNGDCFNGSGNNDPIDEIGFDSYEPQTPLIVTPSMLGIFANTCADILMGAYSRTVKIPQGIRTLVIRSRK